MFLSAMLKKYSISKNQNDKYSSFLFKEIKKRFSNNDKVNLIIANNYRKKMNVLKLLRFIMN